MEFENLKGKILTNIVNNGDEIIFTANNGERYLMMHEQDCCEDVRVEDIAGDLNDLIGFPIIMAEMVTSSDESLRREEFDDSFTWTFYKLATIKGYVTIRWLGESNGYYSEEVSFFKME